MKLLILVQWYPPDIRVPARRWGNLIAGMRKLGVECTVISAGDGIFAGYTGNFGEQVIRLSISNLGNVKKNLSASSRQNIGQKIINRVKNKILPPDYRNHSVREWFDQLVIYPEIVDIANKHDYIISSYGPMGPFLLGRWLSRKTGKPWIADLRDTFESKEPNNYSAYYRICDRLIERYILRQAEIRITVGESLAYYLTNKYSVIFNSIYNGWTENDLLKERKKPINGKKYILYAGSIYAHQIAALQIVLDSLKRYPDIYLKIRLLSDNSNGAFSSFATQLSFSDKIEVLSKTTPETVNTELAESLGALVIEEVGDLESFRSGTITGKLLGLLASGSPGISVSSGIGEMRKLVDQTDGWFGVDNIQQFCKALDSLVEFQERLIMNQRVLSGYKAEVQSKVLVNLIRN